MSDMVEKSDFNNYLAGHQKRLFDELEQLKAKKKLAFIKVKDLAVELPKIFNINKIFIFGSLADGTFNTSSDIDLALEGVEEKYHFRIINAAERIAHPFQVDIVLVEEAGMSLKRKIYKEGILIYDRGEIKRL